MSSTNVAVLGGGFFGCWLSGFLAERGHRVTLLERESDLMKGASFKNQARLHGGYHYPRSFTTALACQRQVKRFEQEFASCVVRPKHSLYAIARNGSLISANQFRDLCGRIGAPVKKAGAQLENLFSREQVSAVFEVEEWVFDARELKKLLLERLNQKSVEIRLSAEVENVFRDNSLIIRSSKGTQQEYDEVYVCLYDSTNEFLIRSGLPVIPLQIEYVELALVKAPSSFANMSITVMDGPFWSLMPYPSEDASTLSHVRYTPHHRANERTADQLPQNSGGNKSAFQQMLHDAVRFVPGLGAMHQVGSIFARKAILPRSAETDSRPILFLKNHALEGLHVVVGAKIDTVFDLESEIS